MPDGKIENELNMALEVPEATREKAYGLDVGYEPATNSWELIVKFSGSLERIRQELGISAVELAGQYAILTVPEYLIERLSDYEEIEFIEKPKRLFYEVNEGRTASCINPLQTETYNLFGEGVLVAVIDSGIDYSHPDFRNEDGTTRIAVLWDQTISGDPPVGYDTGTLYTQEQINEALRTPMPERLSIVPSTDLSGHGTHVWCLKNIKRDWRRKDCCNLLRNFLNLIRRRCFKPKIFRLETPSSMSVLYYVKRDSYVTALSINYIGTVFSG